jgi:preprotein translocase subunit SecG
MTTVVLIIHLLLALALIGVILLQKSEGGALGMGGGGMSGFMTGRSTANLLTRTTAVLAALFFVTSISLAILASREREPHSIVDVPASTPAAPPITPATSPGAPPATQAPAPGAAPATPAPAPAQSAPAAPATPTEPTAPLAR